MITASIVIYRNNVFSARSAVESVLASTAIDHLWIVDNSPTDELRCLGEYPRTTYVLTGKNLGFSQGHNLALRKVPAESDYHVIVNPDVRFSDGVVEGLAAFLDSNPDVGLVVPKVLFPDGRVQRVCKRLPAPSDLIARRFLPAPLKQFLKVAMDSYDLMDMDYEKCSEPPCVMGCFLFLRTRLLREIGGFDPRFFMYLEDIDMCRRLRKLTKIVYLPSVQIFHEHGRESYRNLKQLTHHIHSAIAYFNKWGWFFDPERDLWNRAPHQRSYVE